MRLVRRHEPPSWLKNWRYPPHNVSVWPPANVLLVDSYPSPLASPMVASSIVSSSGATAMATTVDPADVIFHLQGIPITSERLIYASIVLFVTILLITTSIITIAVIVSSEGLKDITGCYLVSLSVSDLLCGTFITPFSIYAALDSNWQFGNSKHLCKIEAYFEIMIFSSIVYIFLWLGVDRYAALHKPSRYEVEQTFTRCKCWIVFTWITSLLLSCPILAAQMQSKYYEEAFLCVLDWGATKAYSATLGCLVLFPSLISVSYTYHYIFSSMRNQETLEDTQRTLLDTDHSFMMTFFVILAFALSWLPWFGLRAYETVIGEHLSVPPLHFSLMWLAIGGGVWKLLIYLTLNPEFRKGIGSFCQTLCCHRSSEKENRHSYQNLAQQRQRYL